jgi:hypothetical protein
VSQIDPLIARQIMQELAKREQTKASVRFKRLATESELELANTLEAKLYDKQKQCWYHPARRKIICGSRRIGKSTLLVLGSCITLLRNPDAHIMYVHKTLKLARPQYFNELCAIIEEYALPLDYTVADMVVTHARGLGGIHIRSAETQADVNNLIGFKLTLAMIDESGQYGPKMESAVMSKIGPSLRDKEGTLILTGTPSDMPEGLFYEAASGIDNTFVPFHWDMRDNPYMPPSAKDYNAIIKEEGFSGWDDPRFIREYLGKFAVSMERQVFHFDPKINIYQRADLEGYEFLIGADFGVADASAVVVLAFKRDTYKLYAVESWSQAKATVDDVAAVIQVYMDRYHTRKVVGDKGGLGKAYTNEIWQRHQIYIDTAEKRDKREFIGVLNSWLKSGNLVIRHESSLAKEIPYVLWNASRTAVDNNAKDDNCHALLYAFRGALPFIRRKQEIQAVADTGETIDPHKEALFKQKPQDVEPIDTDKWSISDFKW